jgi:hypothetical protein
MEQTTFLSVPKLRTRGWTPALIASYLGEPDGTRRNPRYRSAAPMRLYREDRVVEAEATPHWQAAAARAKVRSQAAHAVADRKRAALLRQVAELPITVRRLPQEKVAPRAITAYNQWRGMLADDSFYRQERYGDFTPASAQSDPAFLERIVVNFLRHRLTFYEEQIEDLCGQVGVDEAIALLRTRIYQEIARVYPRYAAVECDRQLRQRVSEAQAEQKDATPGDAPGAHEAERG